MSSENKYRDAHTYTQRDVVYSDRSHMYTVTEHFPQYRILE